MAHAGSRAVSDTGNLTKRTSVTVASVRDYQKALFSFSSHTSAHGGKFRDVNIS
jgi:hypothetical protein